MEFTLNIGILCQFGVRKLVENSPTNPALTSARAVGWTSRVMSSLPKVKTSLIWGSSPSAHWMNSGPYSYPLPESESRRMAPTGSRPTIIFLKLHRIEWSGRGQSKTIMLKLILKPGGKFNILGAKIILLVYHLWTWLLLVQTRPT